MGYEKFRDAVLWPLIMTATYFGVFLLILLGIKYTFDQSPSNPDSVNYYKNQIIFDKRWVSST